jgi:hypothetical protein
MVRFVAVQLLLALLAATQQGSAATITGLVTDGAGNPLEGVRIDHIGKLVVVGPTDLALSPSADEIRTDAEGRFRVVTNVRAFVIRKPGYESQRVRVTGDAQVAITLQRIISTSRCKLQATPPFKTKAANDIDYTATLYYVKTKDGSIGILSGSGSAYSFGAPSDIDVWASVEYAELMYENGIVDASGRSADGTYWRRRSIFGAAAWYYTHSRNAAEILDCLMDRVPIKLH